MTKQDKLKQEILTGRVKDKESALRFVIQEKEREKLIKEIIPQIKLPETLKGEPGKDGVDGKDGQKGEKGRDGHNPDVATVVREAVVALEPLVPTIDSILLELPSGGKIYRDGLELLTGDERLDASAIKNLPKTGDKYYGGAGIKELIAGTGITIDNTNLGYPVITSTGGDTSGLVPYTGATTDVDLGLYGFSAIGGFLKTNNGELCFNANSSGFGFYDDNIQTTTWLGIYSLSPSVFTIMNADGVYAGLDFSLQTSDQTFTFPDASGTLVVGTPWTGMGYLTSLSGAWLNATAQTSLTGNKSGSFNLSTTGTGLFGTAGASPLLTVGNGTGQAIMQVTGTATTGTASGISFFNASHSEFVIANAATGIMYFSTNPASYSQADLLSSAAFSISSLNVISFYKPITIGTATTGTTPLFQVGDGSGLSSSKIYANGVAIQSLFSNGAREGFIAQSTTNLMIGNTGGLANYTQANLLANSNIVISTTGNVGIGVTANPIQKLEVHSTTDYPATMDGISISSLSGQRLNIGYGSLVQNVQQAQMLVDSFGNLNFSPRTNYQSGINFYATPISAPTASVLAMSIIENGNVGIGIATPTQKLDILGNINLTGDRSASLNVLNVTGATGLSGLAEGQKVILNGGVGGIFSFANGRVGKGGSVTFYGGVGAAATNIALNGGIGGNATFYGGNGGAATRSDAVVTGPQGGNMTLGSGNGGWTTQNGNFASIAGNSGDVQLIIGGGGLAIANGSGSAVGGNTGNLNVSSSQAGTGTSNGTGNATGGAGGRISFTGAPGGSGEITDAGATAYGGAGGSILFTAGPGGGTSDTTYEGIGTGYAGNGGDVTFQPGARGYDYNGYTNDGLPGNIYFNDENGSPVVTILGTGNAVGIGTTTPNANALLDITSTTKAFMPPRMTTTQRDAIASPQEGMVIYNLTTHVLNFHNGTSWGAI